MPGQQREVHAAGHEQVAAGIVPMVRLNGLGRLDGDGAALARSLASVFGQPRKVHAVEGPGGFENVVDLVADVTLAIRRHDAFPPLGKGLFRVSTAGTRSLSSTRAIAPARPWDEPVPQPRRIHIEK